MIEAEVTDHLRLWLASATLTDAYVAPSDAVVPGGDFLTLQLSGIEDMGGPLVRQIVQDGTGQDGKPDYFDVPVLLRHWRYSVNCYASDPMDRLSRVLMWARSETALMALWPLVPVLPLKTIRNIPEQRDGGWQGRGQLDFAVCAYVQRGTITDGNGDTVSLGRVPMDIITSGEIVGQPDGPTVPYTLTEE